MKLLDGKQTSGRVLDEITREVAKEKNVGKRAPCLATVLVGEDPASGVYVKNKIKACEKTGMRSMHLKLDAGISESDLIRKVQELNQNKDVDGILVQLPLPKGIDSNKVLETILPAKDVDGFHAVNVGKLWQGVPGLVSCTPSGVIRLLKDHDIPLAGQHAVVMGRSNIVGKPMAGLLLQEHCTVTVVHSKTKNLPELTRLADILVVAIGQPEFLKAHHVQEGAIVVDVGIHKNAQGKLVGDVAFEEVAPKCSFISPVPGGVGPLTIAMLMQNTLQAYRNKTIS